MISQTEWSIRLLEESKDWDYFAFATLTYNDEHLTPPLEGIRYRGNPITLHSTRISDVSQLIKYLRNRYKQTYHKNAPFVYFYCSEYGSRTFRPHYHLLMFSRDTSIFRWLRAYWQKRHGFVYFSRSRLGCDFFRCSGGESSSLSRCVRYVSKYCNKADCNLHFSISGLDSSRSNPDLDFNDFDTTQLERPQRRMSRNLGLGYLAFGRSFDNVRRISHLAPLSAAEASQNVNGLSYPLVTRNGLKLLPLPRYYRKKLLYREGVPELKWRIKKVKTPFGDTSFEMVKVPVSNPVQTPTSRKISYGLRRKSAIRLDDVQRAQEEKGMDAQSVVRLLDSANTHDISNRAEKYRERNVQDFNKSEF